MKDMSMAQITVNQDSLKTAREFKRHQVQPGSNIYRVLPPFGDLQVHNNYPYKKWTLAWLLDPQSGRRKPFAIPYVDKKKDPITEYVNALAAFIDNLKKSMSAKGMSDAEIKEVTGAAAEVVWNMRPKTGYYYNGINKAGEVGILELKATAHRELKTAMMEYIKDYAQDPTSLTCDDDDSGVWFNIKRDGEKGSKDTKYSVVKHQTKVKENGRISFIDDRESLPDNVMENYNKLGYDLYNLYQEKTYDDLKAVLDHNISILAAEIPLLKKVPGYGAPAAVVSATQSSGDDEGEDAPVPTPAKTVVKGKKPVVIAMDDDEDEEEATPVKPVPKPAATKTDLDDLDALLKMIE